MHERARNSLAPSGLLLGDDNDIDRNGKRREGIAQTNHLAQLAVHMLLDYQEVKIAVLARISTRPRSEEQYTGRRTRSCRQPPPGIHDHRITDHVPYGTR